MAAKMKTDTFANLAAVFPVEASAGTAVYTKYAFPFSIMDKMGLIINRIEYWPTNLNNLNSSTDAVTGGLSISSSITDLSDQSNPAIVDSFRFQRIDIGTAASGLFVSEAFVKDFSALPGGGLLVAPNPLYGFVQSTNAGGVMGCWIKLFYTYMELTADEYWQLVESRRIISS